MENEMWNATTRDRHSRFLTPRPSSPGPSGCLLTFTALNIHRISGTWREEQGVSPRKWPTLARMHPENGVGRNNWQRIFFKFFSSHLRIAKLSSLHTDTRTRKNLDNTSLPQDWRTAARGSNKNANLPPDKSWSDTAAHDGNCRSVFPIINY